MSLILINKQLINKQVVFVYRVPIISVPQNPKTLPRTTIWSLRIFLKDSESVQAFKNEENFRTFQEAKNIVFSQPIFLDSIQVRMGLSRFPNSEHTYRPDKNKCVLKHMQKSRTYND